MNMTLDQKGRVSLGAVFVINRATNCKPNEMGNELPTSMSNCMKERIS